MLHEFYVLTLVITAQRVLGVVDEKVHKGALFKDFNIAMNTTNRFLLRFEICKFLFEQLLEIYYHPFDTRDRHDL